MAYYLVKLAITMVLIIMISEVSKRSSFIGAVLASIPLTSVIAMVWLYKDIKNVEKVSALASSVFWLVLPSLVLFITLPILLKQRLNFYISLCISIAFTSGGYQLMITVLNDFGVKL